MCTYLNLSYLYFRPTALRTNSAYIKYYIVYFRLFFLAVLPLLIMIVLNIRIAADIKSAKVILVAAISVFFEIEKYNNIIQNNSFRYF